VNFLPLLFDPNSLRRVIVNWEACAKALLNEAYRRLAWARDDMLKALISDILKYPRVPARWREPELEGPQALILPMELNLKRQDRPDVQHCHERGDAARCYVQELHVEVFYPADAETEARVLTGACGRAVSTALTVCRRTVGQQSFRVVQVSRLLVRLTAFEVRPRALPPACFVIVVMADLLRLLIGWVFLHAG
jgi:hypothetical protein